MTASTLAIHKTEAIIEKLKQIKQGLLHDLLTRGIDANGELRPPPELAPQLYKESSLGTIPRDWECSELQKYAEITVAYVGPTNPFYTDQDKGILFLRTGNITDRGIDLSDIKWVKKTFHEAQKKSSLLEGDVVVSRVGYTGIAAVISGLGEVNSANMIIIRPRSNIASEWIRRLFGVGIYVHQINGFTAGSAQPVLNIHLVDRLITPIPPLSEQITIIKRLASIDLHIDGEQVTLKKLEAQKTALMNDLLTGQVRVTPLLEKHDGPHYPALARESPP